MGKEPICIALEAGSQVEGHRLRLREHLEHLHSIHRACSSPDLREAVRCTWNFASCSVSQLLQRFCHQRRLGRPRNSTSRWGPLIRAIEAAKLQQGHPDDLAICFVTLCHTQGFRTRVVHCFDSDDVDIRSTGVFGFPTFDVAIWPEVFDANTCTWIAVDLVSGALVLDPAGQHWVQRSTPMLWVTSVESIDGAGYVLTDLTQCYIRDWQSDKRRRDGEDLHSWWLDALAQRTCALNLAPTDVQHKPLIFRLPASPNSYPPGAKQKSIKRTFSGGEIGKTSRDGNSVKAKMVRPINILSDHVEMPSRVTHVPASCGRGIFPPILPSIDPEVCKNDLTKFQTSDSKPLLLGIARDRGSLPSLGASSATPAFCEDSIINLHASTDIPSLSGGTLHELPSASSCAIDADCISKTPPRGSDVKAEEDLTSSVHSARAQTHCPASVDDVPADRVEGDSSITHTCVLSEVCNDGLFEDHFSYDIPSCAGDAPTAFDLPSPIHETERFERSDPPESTPNFALDYTSALARSSLDYFQEFSVGSGSCGNSFVVAEDTSSLFRPSDDISLSAGDASASIAFAPATATAVVEKRAPPRLKRHLLRTAPLLSHFQTDLTSLTAFVQRRGHLPWYASLDANERYLGRWVDRVRRARTMKLLNVEQLQRLDAVANWTWTLTPRPSANRAEAKREASRRAVRLVAQTATSSSRVSAAELRARSRQRLQEQMTKLSASDRFERGVQLALQRMAVELALAADAGRKRALLRSWQRKFHPDKNQDRAREVLPLFQWVQSMWEYMCREGA